MAACYWARWSCRQQLSELRNLILPLVLSEGYELVTWNADWQVFDRGGIERKLAWSLNGGRWYDSPTTLRVTYDWTPGETTVSFHWSLSVKPLPRTVRERASFESWVRGQMGRIATGLGEQIGEMVMMGDSSDSGVFCALHDLAGHVTMAPMEGERARTSAKLARQAHVHEAGGSSLETLTCDKCGREALPIPGTFGKYYCLVCRRHLSQAPAMQEVAG